MRVVIAVLLIILTAGAQAGSQAPSKSVFQTEQIIDFAKQVERYAAEHQAHAFIIGRVGRPQKELPKGIHFTHSRIWSLRC